MADHVQNCRDACQLMAFFLYGIDRNKAIEIYNTGSGTELDEFIIVELHNAFSTLKASKTLTPI
jgi:hypothetical protein